ncbi:3-oxoacyl-ACP reductase [Staphylococcus saccharolyticus]|uniref:3-oxoacyl-ACP reductase n=1 Tax=Staphylococcus saccharolyticus TaxID=33028 RepID=UPI0032DF792F
MIKTAIITRSSRGLGAQIATTLLEKNYNVVVNYKQNKDKAERLIANYDENKTIAIQAYVTNRSEVDQMIQQATEHFGQIDIVINNALVNFKFGPTQQKAFKDLTWEDYEQQLNGTLKGAFNVTQSVISQFFAQQSDCIISIGTNLYQNPVVPYHEYTTAKAGLIGFTRNIAAELGQFGITANVVSGGLLKTMDASAVTTPEVFELIAQTTPLKKVTTPQDVANMVVYLATDEARGVTGQNITVDGGLTMN